MRNLSSKNQYSNWRVRQREADTARRNPADMGWGLSWCAWLPVYQITCFPTNFSCYPIYQISGSPDWQDSECRLRLRLRIIWGGCHLMFLTLRCALYSWFSTNFWCNSIFQVPDVAEVPGFQVTFPLDVAWCTWWFKNLSVPGFRIGNSDWFPTLLNNCFLCGEIAEIYLCISVGVSFYIILNRNFYKLYPNIRRSYPWKWPWKIYG